MEENRTSDVGNSQPQNLTLWRMPWRHRLVPQGMTIKLSVVPWVDVLGQDARNVNDENEE